MRDFVFVQDDQEWVHWGDWSYCQEDGDPDWLSLATLLFASLVWLVVTFST